MVGARGPTGAAGPAGAQGASGETGAQGYSTVGPMGATGPAGPVGAQGLTGQTGAQGATLVGPTGPVGSAGSAGAQGISGQTGARGSVMAGGTGGTGLSGTQGLQGPTGPTGAQGPVGAVDRWTAYRDFSFDDGRMDIRASDRSTVSDIALYLANNPSLQVGIDGTADPRNQNLSDGRVSAVRAALMQAGVQDYRIRRGAFNDPQFRQDGRVEILISTQ